MTSAISRDDVEDFLYRAGIRGHKLAQLMKMIDAYAVARARNYATVPDLVEPWGHLAPGEWDPAAYATRCGSCGKVKKWKGNFSRDKSHPSRYKTICRVCEDDIRPFVPPQPGKSYLCRKCGKNKELAEFPAAKWEKPSRNHWCKACDDKYLVRKKYVCHVCRKHVDAEEFPAEKQQRPRKRCPCNECIRRKQAG